MSEFVLISIKPNHVSSPKCKLAETLGLGVTDPIPEQLQALCEPFPLEQTAAVTVVTVLCVALVAVWETVLGAI